MHGVWRFVHFCSEFGGVGSSSAVGYDGQGQQQIDMRERIGAIIQSTKVPLAASVLFQEIQNVREAHLELHYVMEE